MGRCLDLNLLEFLHLGIEVASSLLDLAFYILDVKFCELCLLFIVLILIIIILQLLSLLFRFPFTRQLFLLLVIVVVKTCGIRKFGLTLGALDFL